MTLEILANETLYEIFQFIDVIELFHAFCGLNSRFNTLLFNQLRVYHINFRSILKYQSAVFSQQYFPLIADQIISIRLSDNSDESSSQTDFFFSSNLLLKQFINLRSLSLYHIDCDTTLHKMMIDCQELLHLTHLELIKCHSKYMLSPDLCNTIWSLSKLTHCQLDMDCKFHPPTIVSLSLEYLSISCQFFGLREIYCLFNQTPCLRRLHASFNSLDDNLHQMLSSVPSMTTLKLSDVHLFYKIEDILQAMPNLTHFMLDTDSDDCDGYKLEKLINTHLPQLTVFRLRMSIKIYRQNPSEHYVDQLVNSFRTRFWLKIHRWFIRCHYLSHMSYGPILLYTIPYGFIDYDSNMLTIPYKSTCSEDDNHGLYDQVKNLSYSLSSSTKYLSIIQFSNIRNLLINLCFNENVHINVPILYHLMSITVLSADDNAQFYLQSLLDRAPNLSSLTIESWPISEVPVIKNTNTSVRRLDLRMKNINQLYSFFSNEACNTIIHSPFGRQCEEVLIKVQNNKSIFDFVNGMEKLRQLQIQYVLPQKSSCSNQKRYEEETEKFIKWLQRRLSSTRIIPCLKQNCLLSDSLKVWLYLGK